MNINLVTEIFEDAIDIADVRPSSSPLASAMSISGSLKPTTKRGSLKSNICANMRLDVDRVTHRVSADAQSARITNLVEGIEVADFAAKEHVGITGFR